MLFICTMASPIQPFVALALVAVLYNIYRRWTRISVADIPGPESESFLLGNLPELFQGQVGKADFKWQERFGDIVRVKGLFGSNSLLISDPKALHHIYHSGYQIRKQGIRAELTYLLTGPGLAAADGENHRRQRKINSPAFGTNDAKSYVPLFAAYADKLCGKWKEVLGGDASVVVNTPTYFSRFLLDVIGEAAFDYQFGATENDNDPFAKALAGVIPNTFVAPTKASIFLLGLFEFLPSGLSRLFLQYAPSPALKYGRDVARLATNVAKELVDAKSEALLAGKGKRDIMSLLVKANASANPRTSLSEAELLAQMQTIMQAGHETTATSLSWALFELAQHPDVQTKLRAEIQATRRMIRARGSDTQVTAADFEMMPYTTAVMKEVMRYHPVAPLGVREAARDEVLPLSKPVLTLSGKTITEIPIPKGMRLIVSISGYNRKMDVFGQDAHVFNPERWLDGSVQPTTNLGVYGNLMTFGSGHRACIGWRFAIYEFQTFLVEVVNNFEFSIDPATLAKVRRDGAMLMMPAIAGEKGAQMPITLKEVETL
ncbi:cytochrome P450 [Mycena sp. CBHHK59/15]|nr:cytochrome P450 [Mycena sp. CBHHK59/15]